MMIVRQLFALLLVLTMVATTGSMAMMRDRDAGAQVMVICTGAGLQTILLDANGGRVDPAPMCPDCTMVALAGAPVSSGLEICAPVGRMELVLIQSSQAVARRDNAGVSARAPPVG